MSIETVTVKVVEAIRSDKEPESASFNFFMRSRAVSSAAIFLVLFIAVAGTIGHRERIDFLIRKLSADCWCPRFERFLCSSSKPNILLLSSSVGLVPSLMSDIKNGAIAQPKSVIQLQTASVNYACPAFFLEALAGHGINNVSAAHMGIPTANITDDLLLLKNAVAFGKKPDVVIFAVNVRDFVVPANWPAIEKLDEPIQFALGDISPVPVCSSASRLSRQLLVYARPSVLTRYMDEQRFYFAYQTYRGTCKMPLFKALFGQSDILRNRMATESESENHYDAKIAGRINCLMLNPQTQNEILALRNKKFEARQFEAFKQSIALCERHGIKLVITQVPLYPGMCAPAVVERRYTDAIAAAACRKGIFVTNSGKPIDYSYGDFSDLLHLNGVGGERFFWRLADYISIHKTELLSR
ncbi:MAG: hypothetical protein P4L53_27125 [Candidatus Obscuribacterales bacterium]|nr:hypothetical protein [Candidatus Obscuribacterales bacterium]